MKENRNYLECNLPPYLELALDEYKVSINKIDNGIEDCRLDLYFDGLRACINTAENANEISSEQAWYLRNEYLGIEKECL